MAKQVREVVSAKIYTCRQYGVLSRDNTCLEKPRETYNTGQVRQAFEAFADSLERCKLVLVLDNGREISILPTLREDVVAFEEKGFDPKKEIKNPWNVTVEIWPR